MTHYADKPQCSTAGCGRLADVMYGDRPLCIDDFLAERQVDYPTADVEPLPA